MNRPRRTRYLSPLWVLFTSLALAAPAALSGQALSSAFTPAQVECERVKLRGLLYLSSANSSSPMPETLLVSPGPGETVGLLVVANQWGEVREREPLAPERVPEVHLAATLAPAMSDLLLNPERPRLDQLALVRTDPATNLRSHFPDATHLEVAVRAAHLTDRRSWLVLDNGSRSGATRPGRPLRIAGALRECDLPLTAEDRLVLAVLQRLVRPRFQALFPYDFNTDGAWVAIYRAEEPDTFWIDVFENPEVLHPTPPPEDLDVFFVPNRLRLTVERDDRGRLSTGILELVVSRTPGSLVELFFAPPTFPGVEVWSEEGPPTVRLAFPEAFLAGPVALDLAALLDGTTFNPPRFESDTAAD